MQPLAENNDNLKVVIHVEWLELQQSSSALDLYRNTQLTCSLVMPANN